MITQPMSGLRQRTPGAHVSRALLHDRLAPPPGGSRYRLDDVIGRGGMGIVHRGFDTVLRRPVAVKVFRQQEEGADADQRRCEAEVLLLASLSAPGLVTVLDCGSLPGPDGPTPFLVMELLAGPDLAAALQPGPLSVAQVAQVGLDVAGGLAHVHERGIVHRDVKPANIVLAGPIGSEWPVRAKLTDFGIALAFGRLDEDSDDFILGTAAYLSPEQVQGTEVGVASDVYSLGLVLLECLTGRTEFGGGPTESVVARLDRDPAVPDLLPAPWPEVLRAMTARDPHRRPTAAELEGVFRRIVVEHGAHSARVAPPTTGRPLEVPGALPDRRSTASLPTRRAS